MAVQLFYLGDNYPIKGNDDVPWHNTYNKQEDVVGQEVNVAHIAICKTGLLLQSSFFKSYIFKGESLYPLMIDALDYYVSKPEESVPIIMVVTETKQPNYGIEDSYTGDLIWKKQDNTYFFTNPESKIINSGTNPFLPRTSTSKRRKKPS